MSAMSVKQSPTLDGASPKRSAPSSGMSVNIAPAEAAQ